ncbi:MAG: ABC transporter permease [Paludibacteraceae bacterium]|nr:ABC transporter permease [Paludibacteraceae bacterium]
MAIREAEISRRRPLYLFCLLIAPVFFSFMFINVMEEGAPNNIPAAVVDEDDSQVSRTLLRTLDAMQETDLIVKYKTFPDAEDALRKGEVFAIVHVPHGLSEKALTQRTPTIYFYTNDAYFLAGSFLFKNMKVLGELSGLAITKATLSAKGLDEDRIMGLIQPITVESHPLNNPSLNYSIYLTNMFIPAILLLIIFIATCYSIGLEWKRGTQKKWFQESGENVIIALTGKLLPQTAVYMLMFAFMDVYLYKINGFPIACPLLRLLGIQLLVTLASQAFSTAIFGILAGQMRLAMSVASLLGVLSISLCGFTFPVLAMPKIMEAISWLLPLRHYYLIYINQVLDGYSIIYVWKSFAILVAILGLPLLFVKVYEKAFNEVNYKA